jgi:hypothetical protein
MAAHFKKKKKKKKLIRGNNCRGFCGFSVPQRFLDDVVVPSPLFVGWWGVSHAFS